MPALLPLLFIPIIFALSQQQIGSGCDSLPEGQTICPYSFGGFHFVCPPIDHSTAFRRCGEISSAWQLAVVTDENSWAAWQTMQYCSGHWQAWIASFNGYPQDPCMLQLSPGLANGNLGGACDFWGAQLLCQDIPIITHYTSTTRTQTIYTQPVTVTVIVSPTCRPHHKIEEKALPVDKQIFEPPVDPSRPCRPICSTKSTHGYQMIQQPMLYAEAQEACNRIGMTLADVNSAMSAELMPLLVNCTENSLAQYGWIRSFDGVSGGSCLMAAPGLSYPWEGPYRTFFDPANAIPVGPVFGYSDAACESIGLQYPICQPACPNQITGHGPDGGATRDYTSLISTATTAFAPIRTATVTVTKWPKHTNKPDCCCHECWLRKLLK